MITIRLLKAEDVVAYRRLRLEALLDSPAAFCSSHEEELRKPLEEWVSRLEDNSVFGACAEDGQLIGILGLIREDRIKRAHSASLVGMHVSPPFRRQGIGGMLLDHAIQFARQLGGIKTLKLSVMTTNQDATRLYRARGFKSYGLEPEALFVDGQYHDEDYLILRLED